MGAGAGHFQTREDLRAYIAGGQGTLTLVSRVTGHRRTLSFKRGKDDRVRFSLLVGGGSYHPVAEWPFGGDRLFPAPDLEQTGRHHAFDVVRWFLA